MEIKTWSQLIDGILLRKVAFAVAFFVVFISSYALLSWLDFLPEPIREDITPEEVVTEVVETPVVATPAVKVREILPVAEEVVSPAFPLSITINPLQKTSTVLNPTSRAVAELDADLLRGVVRHPDSAALNQKGTVFLLGHSSYLPVVNNKNFQAFNGIQDLKWGDTIVVSSTHDEYVYRVDKVYRARAKDVTVPIAGSTQKLFLATCNSFGSTDDRYVVEADLIEVRPLAS